MRHSPRFAAFGLHDFRKRVWRCIFWPMKKSRILPSTGPKIERVVSNLLENASKFTPAGGTVWLHAEPYMWERRSIAKPAINQERRRRPLTAPNSVKISVSDTGPGIPPEYHLEIFDDFFRLPTNEKADGMGLGLAIARRLVLGMGGKIWVESEPSAGCKFSFIVPLNPVLADSEGKK